MENKKLNLQVGDRITYKHDVMEVENTEVIYDLARISTLVFEIEKGNMKILKIERPHYEVVEENVIEEKKELLTGEEKDFLKFILRYYKATTIYFDVDRVLFFDDIIEEISPNYPKGLKFEGVKKHTQYDLEELGLEEK